MYRQLVLPLLLASASLAQTTTTGTATRTTALPPIGLAASETAQVNVVNLASNPTTGTAASCAGSISFLSAAGATIGSAATFTVASGQTFSATHP